MSQAANAPTSDGIHDSLRFGGSSPFADHSHATLPSAQAQILLKALQCFIMPLIQLDRIERKPIDITMGPEGEEFLAALHKFVSNVIKSELNHQDHIDVDSETLDKPSTALAEQLPVTSPSKDSESVANDRLVLRPNLRFSEAPSDIEPDSDSRLISDVIDICQSSINNDATTLSLQPTRTEKVLAALRYHVFNKMPIRLLFFKPNDSNLHITLLERGEIYALLAPQLQSEFNEEQFLFEIETNIKPWVSEAEAEAEAIEGCISKYTRYAILSHTWIREASGEVTYGDWCRGSVDSKHLGHQKLIRFCQTSWDNHGINLGWMDTVCINKESSAELDESIRSMYKWYREANICITYLAETASLADMHNDPWFTRGWTLQELLAPNFIKFYNTYWQQFVESSLYTDALDTELQEQIELATTITEYELRDIRATSISRRMQLAAKREVTREEDSAYSLMGIFDISISIAYGEGAERAFFRLIKELLSSYRNVFDIFNWAYDLPSPWTSISSLLPTSPQHYLYRYSYRQMESIRPIEPLTLTHLGLRIPILLMPGISFNDPAVSQNPIGNYYAVVDITPIKLWEDELRAHTYTLLDKRISGPDGRNAEGGFQMTFGILNFGGDESNIHVAKNCHAVGLSCQEDAGSVTTLGPVTKIDTQAPIFFELCSTDTFESVEVSRPYYQIARNRLAHHGIQLVTLYL